MEDDNMEEIKGLANEILDKKVEVRKLQVEVSNMEDALVRKLAKQRPDMLSVNWDRLVRVSGITPMRYR
jgi:hypothetical protein